MLDKDTLDGVYQDIADGGYLDDWVLNCSRAMRDQAKQAIDLVAENERLKSKLDTLTAISERDDRCYAQLKAKFDAVRKWASNPVRIDDFGYQMAQESVLAIIDGGGDET